MNTFYGIITVNIFTRFFGKIPIYMGKSLFMCLILYSQWSYISDNIIKYETKYYILSLITYQLFLLSSDAFNNIFLVLYIYLHILNNTQNVYLI